MIIFLNPHEHDQRLVAVDVDYRLRADTTPLHYLMPFAGPVNALNCGQIPESANEDSPV